MVRVANPSHVKAARLRESGIEWSIALEKAKVPDTDLTRKSVRRIIRELVSTAKAEEGGAALPKKKQRAAKEKKSYVAAYSQHPCCCPLYIYARCQPHAPPTDVNNR
jgi:hypothetical protein